MQLRYASQAHQVHVAMRYDARQALIAFPHHDDAHALHVLHLAHDAHVQDAEVYWPGLPYGDESNELCLHSLPAPHHLRLLVNVSTLDVLH